MSINECRNFLRNCFISGDATGPENVSPLSLTIGDQFLGTKAAKWRPTARHPLYVVLVIGDNDMVRCAAAVPTLPPSRDDNEITSGSELAEKVPEKGDRSTFVLDCGVESLKVVED